MNKEKKTEQLGLSGLIGEYEKQASEGQIGIIAEIMPITNSKYFGESGMYGEKDGFSIVVKIKDSDETKHGCSQCQVICCVISPQEDARKLGDIVRNTQLYSK